MKTNSDEWFYWPATGRFYNRNNVSPSMSSYEYYRMTEPAKSISNPKETSKDKQVGTEAYKNGSYKDFVIQPIDFIVKNKLGWHEGNAIKYISRHKMKNGKEDILKAIHYLEMLIEEFYPEGDKT